MLRAIALSLVLLFGIGIVVSLTTNGAEAGSRRHNKHRKHYKKYSKAWWRQYHRRVKRKKEAATQWRKARLRQLRQAKMTNDAPNADNSQAAVKSKTADDAPAVLPTGETAPKNWKKGQNSSSEMQYRVDDNFGSQIGAAAITVVGPAVGEDSETAHVKTLGGVATTALRRTVIDKMIRENGWVVNDYQKTVGGKTVYVVLAQSQTKSGKMQSRIFYFTRADGRIYSVAANAPTDAAERLAEDTERVVNSLQKPTQQAELR